MSDSDAVLITGEVKKLPPELADLLDPQRPLPIGVSFFEKAFTPSDLVITTAWSLGLGVLGLICTGFGLVFAIDSMSDRYQSSSMYVPLIFGLVCLLAAWIMFTSLSTRRAMRQRQRVGQSSRLGTYLTGSGLFQASEMDYVVIPPVCFRGLEGNTVKYVLNEQEKSFRLPAEVFNGTVEERSAAIQKWAVQNGAPGTASGQGV